MNFKKLPNLLLRTWSKGLLFSILIIVNCEIQASEVRGRVIAVTDGDTMTVLDSALVEHKIRIAGIDAPEKKQSFGMRSKQNLAAASFNRSAVVIYLKRDRYGRVIGKVLIDGLDLGLLQISSGMAWHYKKYAREQSEPDRRSYNEAEQTAKRNKKGIWSDATPIAPWEFRKRKLDERARMHCTQDVACHNLAERIS